MPSCSSGLGMWACSKFLTSEEHRNTHAAISARRGPLPPLEGKDHLGWSVCVGRIGLARPRLLCDSGRAKARGGRQAENSSLRSSKAPTRSTHTLILYNSRSSRRSSPPSMGFMGEKAKATNGCRLSLLPSRQSCSGPVLAISGTG
jgi:hypothetical protein